MSGLARIDYGFFAFMGYLGIIFTIVVPWFDKDYFSSFIVPSLPSWFTVFVLYPLVTMLSFVIATFYTLGAIRYHRWFPPEKPKLREVRIENQGTITFPCCCGKDHSKNPICHKGLGIGCSGKANTFCEWCTPCVIQYKTKHPEWNLKWAVKSKDETV